MPDVTIYHNPHCNSSGNAVRIAEELGVDADIVLYLKTPSRRGDTAHDHRQTRGPATDLVRRDNLWKKLELTDDDVATVDQIVDVLVKHKQLLQRPLVVTADAAIIGRPKERVTALLSAQA